jgi:hypothetical protein
VIVVGRISSGYWSVNFFAIGAVASIVPVLVTGLQVMSAAIIPIAVGLVVLLGVYLNLRDNTKKAADATIELTSAQKLMQTVTDEGQAYCGPKNQIRILTTNSTK